MSFPNVRLRRLRSSKSIRKMLAKPFPDFSQFIYPIFVIEGEKKVQPIDSMPQQSRYSVDELAKAIKPLVEKGLGGVMVFGVVEDYCKTTNAAYAFSENGVVQNAVRELKKNFPNLLVFTDVCMCAYTTHGHCGILAENGEILNDDSLDILATIALSHAIAGADGVAPSAMMDGQISAIRKKLDEYGFLNTILMSYSTKFASAMYGPFREAADSSPSQGDRKSYQQPINDFSQAIRESLEDVNEGADILMIKPALFYLDIVAKVKAESHLPLAIYNVSGEYSMIYATAEKGWGDLYAMARESIVALQRAGADIFISYWANQYDKLKDN